MATITSVGSGNWSTAGTWDSGVPADGDNVVISAGHTVTFDGGQSAFGTGIDGITITGTLKLSRLTGTYYLYMKAGALISGTGTFDCGTELDPVPYVSNHTITGGALWRIDMPNGYLTVVGAEPVYKYVKTTTETLLGETVYNIDTDLTGDIWRVGDTVGIISESNSYGQSCTIVDVAPATITVSTGAPANRSSVTYIALLTRNINFICIPTGAISTFVNTPYALINGGWFRCNISSAGQRCFNSLYSEFKGGVVTSFGFGGYSIAYSDVTGTLFMFNAYHMANCANTMIDGGIFLGGSYPLQSNNGLIVKSGLFACGAQLFYSTNGITVTGGTFDGNLYTFLNISALKVSNIAPTNTAYFIRDCADAQLLNIDATGCTYFFNKYTAGVNRDYLATSFNHNKIEGNDKYMTFGGDTSLETTIVPSGYTNSFKTSLVSNTRHGYYTKPFRLSPSQNAVAKIYLRKDSSMTYLPRVYLMSYFEDPFEGAAPLQTFIMTDTIDTWESGTIAVSNLSEYDKEYVLWVNGLNSSGTLYSVVDIEVNSNITTDVLALLNTIDGKADTIDANVDTIKSKTDNLPADPADDSDIDAQLAAIKAETAAILVDTGTTLDGNITAILADTNEVQAELADGGRTDLLIDSIIAHLVGIKGAGWSTETLKVIKDAVTNVDGDLADVFDDVGDVLDKLNVSTVQFVTSVVGSTITILRGDTLTASLLNLGSMESYVSLDFTVKASTHQSDDAALIRVRKNASGLTDGLLRLNGAAHTTGTDGSITINDAPTGDITIMLKATVTDDLVPGTYVYDIQLIEAAEVTTLTTGSLIVSADVTRLVA